MNLNSTRRRAVALTLVLLASRVSAVDPEPGPGPPSRFSVQLGGGGGNAGAPNLLMGAGWAPVETGTLRLDLFLRLGLGFADKVHYEEPSGMAGDASLTAVSGHLDLALARRFGRFEPFAGGGLAVVGADGNLESWCRVELAPACAASTPQPRTKTRVTGSSIWGASAFGGVRLALGDQLLLEAELRYEKEGRSHLEEAPISIPVGGYAGLLSATWRFGQGRPLRPGAPTPRPVYDPIPAVGTAAAPPGQEPPPQLSCAPGLSPTVALHAARAFLCRPDPVRGGHYCEPRALVGEFIALEACEAACRGEGAGCTVGGPACDRCVKGCGETTYVPCPAEPAWAGGRPVCLLPAGRWGLEAETAVPASCGRGR